MHRARFYRSDPASKKEGDYATKKGIHDLNYYVGVVAQKRFELLSKAPEASMLDHYTTGLRFTVTTMNLYIITLALPPTPKTID